MAQRLGMQGWGFVDETLCSGILKFLGNHSECIAEHSDDTTLYDASRNPEIILSCTLDASGILQWKPTTDSTIGRQCLAPAGEGNSMGDVGN